jgi:LemA protein
LLLQNTIFGHGNKTHKKMKLSRGLITIIILVVVAFLLYSFFRNTYNKLVTTAEDTKGKWSMVESQYQRRADLIPHLVETVKGYADFEQQTLTQVVEARSRATQITVNPDNLTPDEILKFQQAQDGVTSALSRLLAVVENYPDLKANQNFLDLQAQLEGTENRINKARDDFNLSIQAYNTYMKQFPTNILAGIFGFSEKGYFESQPGTETAPKVEF